MFEYKVIRIYSSTEGHDEMMFNSMGKVGWELVSITDSPPRAYFKREVK